MYCRCGGVLSTWLCVVAWRCVVGVVVCCPRGGVLSAWRCVVGVAVCCRRGCVLSTWRCVVHVVVCCPHGGVLSAWWYVVHVAQERCAPKGQQATSPGQAKRRPGYVFTPTILRPERAKALMLNMLLHSHSRFCPFRAPAYGGMIPRAPLRLPWADGLLGFQPVFGVLPWAHCLWHTSLGHTSLGHCLPGVCPPGKGLSGVSVLPSCRPPHRRRCGLAVRGGRSCHIWRHCFWCPPRRICRFPCRG